MKIALPNLSELPWRVRDAMENLEVQIGSGWGMQHKGDGSHAAITGDSVTVTGVMSGDAGTRSAGPHRLGRAGILNPPQITANQNNYNPINLDTAGLLRVTANGAYNITGLQAPRVLFGASTDFTRIAWTNRSNFTLTLMHNSGSSSTLNRFSCPRSVDFGLTSGGTVWMYYDTSAGSWVVEGV